MDFGRHFGHASRRRLVRIRLVFGSPGPFRTDSPHLDGILVKEKESFSKLTAIAVEAALLAGEILRRGFGTSFSIAHKAGRHNLVTEYDRASEQAILSFLSQNVPGSQFLAEESGASGQKGEILWIIDPLDGTVNFAHRVPVFSVSIAAQKGNDVVVGVVYQPITHELFVAEKGKGAFLNGEKISVSEISVLEDSILATGFPYNLIENPHHCIDHFVDILRKGIPIRRLGSAAIDLAYTASGRFDGYFEVELEPWDLAAGKLLVEEAGGLVTSWDGKPFHIRSRSPFLATNRKIHTSVSTLLTKSMP